MQKFFMLILATLFVVAANAAPPSEESINKLLSVTKSEAAVTAMNANMETYLRQAIVNMPRAKQLSAEQRGTLDTVMVKMAKIIREEMSWEKMRPTYLQLYRESLSQEEVDGMIAFYQTPAGEAVINKLPIIMQKSMQITQARMQPIMEKMEPMLDDAIAQMQADTKSKQPAGK